MNDELTKAINETKQKLADALNTSNLHPMILQMILNDFMHQINDAIKAPQLQEGEGEGHDHTEL